MNDNESASGRPGRVWPGRTGHLEPTHEDRYRIITSRGVTSRTRRRRS